MQNRIESIHVGTAWSGHPVGFALLTVEDRQFVGYYDENRELVVASRSLDSGEWHSVQLPERVGWDSHNSIVLACDETGRLHLAANMHVDPLVYFRTQEAGDIDTFERIPAMVGEDEDQVTYPEFFTGPGDALCFGYRSGSSGKGDQIYNRYDSTTERWSRLNTGVVVSGEGLRNAYLDGPALGPDGWFHLCWVWRDSPDAASNHDLSYARSRDLVRWETSSGTILRTPITFDTAEIVDPVPVGHGIMNGNTRIGFDAQGHLVLTYCKLDPQGSTQTYCARPEGDRWSIFPITEWTGAWLPEGWGTIIPEITIHPVQTDRQGRVTMRYEHQRLGSGKWQLDPATLLPIADLPLASEERRALDQASRSEWQVNWLRDSGIRDGHPAPYALRWETFPQNRDAPRDVGEAPPPSDLSVVRLAPADLD